MTEVFEEGPNERAPVRVVQAPDPDDRAADLAREHDADLAADLGTAEAEVRRRVEAGRRALRPAGPDEGPDLLARASEIREGASEAPPISDADVEELERLAADLARAARIRARTEAKFNENLQAKLAASAGIALHPGAIKEAAEGVVAAEASLTEAEQALTAHGPRPVPGAGSEADWRLGAKLDHRDAVDDPVLAKPHDDFDEVALDRRRATVRGAALFLVLAGLGVIALGLDASPAITVTLAVVGLVLGIATIVRGRKAATLLADDKAHSAARLADLPNASGLGSIGATDAGADDDDPATDRAREADPSAVAIADPAPAPVPAAAPGSDDEDPWLEERLVLDAARDEAEEQVRTTRRRWHQLAGVDADPYDAEGVIRAHDPQLAFDDRVALASPTVRTVAAFHRKAQARWRVLWAGLGHDEPPEVDSLDATLEDLLGDHRRRQADLRRLEAAEDRAQAEADARKPLVLVEPREWVSATRLAQLLSSVPPQGEIYVVERESA